MIVCLVLVLVLVQGVWVTAGRVAACPLPNAHVAVSSWGHYITVAPASTPGGMPATLPLTVTDWDWTNFEFWPIRRRNRLLFRLNLISFLYPRILSASVI